MFFNNEQPGKVGQKQVLELHSFGFKTWKIHFKLSGSVWINLQNRDVEFVNKNPVKRFN